MGNPAEETFYHQDTSIYARCREAVKANRARVAEDDSKGVAELRRQGMQIVENPDKAKFIAALAGANAEFEKQFGKAAIDKIRNYK